jgi:hypothetical protein
MMGRSFYEAREAGKYKEGGLEYKVLGSKVRKFY